MISKALLPTNLCAIDFKATLDDWGVPVRTILNSQGQPTRYVVFDAASLSHWQMANLDATYTPIYCKIDVFDIRFMEEICCNVNDKPLTSTKEVKNGNNT